MEGRDRKAAGVVRGVSPTLQDRKNADDICLDREVDATAKPDPILSKPGAVGHQMALPRGSATLIYGIRGGPSQECLR
jgi:hypothetical protein